MADENGVRRGTVSAAERAFAALVGYTAGAAVVLPFDRVKSLLQVSALSRRQGAVGVAKQLFQAHGMGGLYQGGTAHMLIAPYTVFYYSLYDEILAHGRRATSETHGVSGHPLTPLFAALVARSVETVARQPLELVRTLMQSSNASITISESWHALRGQPLHCWFRGMTPTLLRDVPFSGTYWLFYETAKQRVRIPEEAVRSATARTLLQSLLCGAGAGMAATVLIAPLDPAVAASLLISACARCRARLLSSRAKTIIQGSLPVRPARPVCNACVGSTVSFRLRPAVKIARSEVVVAPRS